MTNETLVGRLDSPAGGVKEMGIVVLAASSHKVICAREVGEELLQSSGIAHGDVHCEVIETLTSIGAALVAQPSGQRVAGLANSTTFIPAVCSGKLHGVVATRCGARCQGLAVGA
jgi:acyl-coenzyme A thioesterase PaaI-like protein